MKTSNTNDGTLAERLASEIARDWAEGRNDSIVTRMSAQMAAELSASELAKLWQSLTSQLGPCSDVGEAWTERQGDFPTLRVPLTFAARALDLKLAIVSNEILGFYVSPRLEPASRWQMPDYADASAFREREVNIGVAPNALPGTLTLPERNSPAPVVVLVHGSGPRDRDESHGPNRPFRDLAVGLAARGVAVLRYEKRTKAHPRSLVRLKAPTVMDETIDDVGLAVAYLQARPEIDPRRITIVGHSLGGTLGPRIAANCPAVAGLVLLAAATRPLPEVAIAQIEYISRLNGDPPSEQVAEIAALRAEAARVCAARPGDEGPGFLGAPLSYWADLNAYDPLAVAAGLKIPMLILQGGRDYQVTSEDLSRFRLGLADLPNVRCVGLPRLNHLFMAGEGESTPAEYDIAGHVDREVIERIADFALAQ